ncbi:MAG: hypothetical protein P8J68_01795 [Arenicellaceae bacterium]|nr:hypothetical protein [Arenicellaceae bacterium]
MRYIILALTQASSLFVAPGVYAVSMDVKSQMHQLLLMRLLVLA